MKIGSTKLPVKAKLRLSRGTMRQPRLGRSGSTELAEVLALPGTSPYPLKLVHVVAQEVLNKKPFGYKLG